MSDSPTRRASCPTCCRPAAHCLCAYIPRIDSATAILVIQHPAERKHALNTARLLTLGLVNARMVITERLDQELVNLLGDASWRTELLFPGPGARPLAATQEDSRPRRLVLLDGTWRKARKLLHLNPALQSLPRVMLEPRERSRYRLRKAPDPSALATIEAGVMALSILEPQQDFRTLLEPFEMLIQGQIDAMGEVCFQRNHGTTTG